NTQYSGPKKEEGYKTEKFANFSVSMKNKYTYVYYPWNFSMVKIVKKNDYLELKTNRNRDLITKKEQDKLRDTKIAVFGMSVGSNISLVLTQAGISNNIVIADFDELDTTNLNRIIAGTHQIGLNKTIIASRRIYEDNPFAKVTSLVKGATKKNVEKLLKEKKIDIIVEEVDNLSFKIDTRKLAIKYKVPVVMITDNGDGVVLHVERYDLGYKKIFNKDIPYWDDILSKPPSMELMGNVIMNDIVGGVKNIDLKMLKSVDKVLKKELVSWSQLGSAAILGGVVATVMIKKIINNEDNHIYIAKNIFVI
ncbi:MAG: ThiF family adenylyltransferase, partial [Patescibacteria group bacterium]|nr:ThiF family adenylyltransferase [Patescibacteria group bacterium]